MTTSGAAAAPLSTTTAPRSHTALQRLSWLAVLVVGTITYLVELAVITSTDNPNFFPSLLILGSCVVPLTVLTFAATSGRRVLAPAGWIAGVAVAGGVVGTLAAGVLEYDSLKRLGAASMLGVGLIEEAAKLVVPAVAFVVLARRHPRAGVVIGVASGMGFAALETMGYGFTALLSSRGSLAAVESTLQLRALLAPAGHVAWTGLTVAAFWRVATSPSRGRALGRALLVFVAAVLLHAAWDGLDALSVHVVVAVVSISALLVVIHRANQVGVPR